MIVYGVAATCTLRVAEKGIFGKSNDLYNLIVIVHSDEELA